jgi:hypothetical protein
MLAVSVPADWPQRTKLSGDELSRRIAGITKAMHGGRRVTRVVVCDDDIDLSDLRDLVWAWNSRCHPVTGHFVMEDVPADPGEPMFAEAHLSVDNALGPIEVLNCLLDPEETDLHISSFDANYPEEIKEHVLARWQEWPLMAAPSWLVSRPYPPSARSTRFPAEPTAGRAGMSAQRLIVGSRAPARHLWPTRCCGR